MIELGTGTATCTARPSAYFAQWLFATSVQQDLDRLVALVEARP